MELRRAGMLLMLTGHLCLTYQLSKDNQENKMQFYFAEH